MTAFRRKRSVLTWIAAALAVVSLAPASVPVFAASNDAAPRITQKIDDAHRVTLKGNVPAIARPEFDKGAIDSSSQLDRMQLVLKRSDAQEQALKTLIDEQHSKGSANFHKWLTPAEFGQRFGVGDADLATVVAWLQGKGFTVKPASKGRTTLEFSGTASQLKSAFHTEIHTYVRKGVTYHANNADPSIPAALAPVVRGIATLNDIKPKSDMKPMGSFAMNMKTHKATPVQWNPELPCPPDYTDNCINYIPTPADMAVQYNSTALLNSGTNGKGYNIGILSASNVDLSAYANYRSVFGLPAQTPSVVIDGNDPGQNGAAGEAYLDIEVSGSMAPGAQVYMYTGADTLVTSGLLAAIIRGVDDNVADTLSLSYGECEQFIGASLNQFFYYEWQQAAAQGQSVFVSAGDGGSAGCDDFDTESQAQYGLAVSGFASTPYNTAVGGTDFYYSNYAEGYNGPDMQAQFAQYWGTSTSDTPAATLMSTIPEQPWNDSLGLNVATGYAGTNIVAGSGGASSCAYGDGDDGEGGYTTCTGGYAKPSWQTGAGVPNDGVRDIPDVSLFAANGLNYSTWPTCGGPYDCNEYVFAGTTTLYFSGVGGTSASSPAMAGVMTLIDQAMGGRQGNANYYLYALATQYPNSFNDVTVGSNNVVCAPGSPDCSADTNGDGFYSLQEYPAGAGYDLASGLGSVNIGNLASNWGKLSFSGTTTTLSLTPTSVVHGTPITASTTVSSGSGTPSGLVALVADTTLPNNAGQGAIPLADGTGSSTISYLPGGSYNVTAQYKGDGTYGASTSSPVAVTITPEDSSITLYAGAYDLYGDTINVQNGGTYSYGNQFFMDAAVSGKSGSGAATGAVSMVDNGSNVASLALNAEGVSEQVSANFKPGPHKLVANYAGDPSFNASSAAINFTITQGTPVVYSEDSSGYVQLYAGQTFQVPLVVLGTYAGGTAPSGTVTVTFGSATQTATLTPAVGFGSAVGTATVSFPNIAAGNYTMTINYAGDGNYTAAAASPETVTVAALGTLAATTTTIATTSTDGVGPNGVLKLSSATTAASGVPTGYVYYYANGIYLTSATLDGTGAAKVTVFYPSIFTGTNSITAQYIGDANYAPSESAPVEVSGNTGDFAITTTAPTVTINSTSNSYTGTLQLSSLSGLGGTVTLSCAPSSPLIFCGFQGNDSVTLSTDGSQVSVPLVVSNQTLKTGTTTTAHNPLRNWLGGGSIAFALLFVFPGRRRRITVKVLMLLCAAGLALGATGCDSSGNGVPGQGVNTAPAGTYSLTITATDSGVQHAITVTVINP